jgi:hypothetical protein
MSTGPCDSHSADFRPHPIDSWGPARRRDLGKLIAQVWRDPDLLSRYEQEPRAVLCEFGLEFRPDELVPVLPVPPVVLLAESLEGSRRQPGFCMPTISSVIFCISNLVPAPLASGSFGDVA